MKTKIIYIAEDGTEFLSKAECERHEFVVVLLSNIRKSIKGYNDAREVVDLARRITNGILNEFHVAAKYV